MFGSSFFEQRTKSQLKHSIIYHTNQTAMSGESSPLSDNTPMDSPMSEAVDSPSSLAELQTEEQRKVLDTIARVRKCGLEGTISLPQIVVCGDQSAGKSSVLEALTEIPFPRNDLLCTRYATEIMLRNAAEDSITIRVIPDSNRPSAEQASIKLFEKSITNFDDLPTIMDDAMAIMGIGVLDATDGNAKPPAFARDVLSVEYAGPDRPQLTLVDIPGLIGAETKATTKMDITLVAEITNHYIKQPRTICLAVVSAGTDYANQSILDRVREVDPEGERTLGVITKPDLPDDGSGHQAGYIDLAKNRDIFFKLGWHVVKNRAWKEKDATLTERKMAEDTFFRTTNWRELPKECVGIDALRRRLSILLFEHVKKELPSLREELEDKLVETQGQLEQLGDPRSSGEECKTYLSGLSLEVWQTCRAAIDGHYEGGYFHHDVDPQFSITSPSTLRRTRAVIQLLNSKFAEDIRLKGHKYQIHMDSGNDDASPAESMSFGSKLSASPKKLNKQAALDWVRDVLVRTRGKELIGNFNPLVIGDLFWELSEKWDRLAHTHVDQVATACQNFLKNLLTDKCPEDVERRIWNTKIADELKKRHAAARAELKLIMNDHKNYPINYNHYYTDTITKRRQDRQQKELTKHIEDATTQDYNKQGFQVVSKINVEQVVTAYNKKVDPNMDNFSCEEALDCLFSIYKVSLLASLFPHLSDPLPHRSSKKPSSQTSPCK
ncbi:putative Interferon-induced GTP-binding protein Mx [Glarea lozoyensis 74030]|uniref:Putative Interferon-induced GTP-binding protein Mx n=1 Tax=Glarea lozoyensis (strain ATCC 74030 / MF5533) TaxID=1104152 RepID=H0EM05_GLAL7|nr:putative Interferon-induced GTP-binding protein Mx [Glarea lozoyensis 74030]